MDAKYVNPFIEAFNFVMPQLGFSNVKIGGLTVKKEKVVNSGVIIVLGIVGDIKGNVAYSMDVPAAKKIASTMLMGSLVVKLDDMAKSALSELSNMLTANAATAFSKSGTAVDISTPTMLEGHNITIDMNITPVLCVQMEVDDIKIDIDISIAA